MFFILIIVVPLVAWSLQLMHQALESREFSLMLAGTLVATAAAAMVVVYFLMGDYMNYVQQMAQNPHFIYNSSQTGALVWIPQTDAEIEAWANWDNQEIAVSQEFQSAPSLRVN